MAGDRSEGLAAGVTVVVRIFVLAIFPRKLQNTSVHTVTVD